MTMASVDSGMVAESAVTRHQPPVVMGEREGN
jgi:hypothetical protein